MLLPIACLAALSGVSLASQAIYQQCGGKNWSGDTSCSPGNSCSYINDWYYQCLPTPNSIGNNAAPQSAYGQCGGTGGGSPNDPRDCTSGFYCSTVNQYYFQCVPGATASAPASQGTSAGPPTTLITSTTSSTSVPKPSSTTSFNVPQPTSTSPQPSVTSSPKAAPTGSGGKMKYAGVNIAGFDFSCSTDGSCQVGGIYAPLPATGGPDGSGQMKHFVQDDNLNAFRLPVSWQYLVDGNLGGSLSANNLGNYDKLLQACLGTGALCIIDIHNYARWNGGVIGQGGPSNDQFVSLWTQLATKYASPTNVAFGIMNEPHDINIQTWAETLQLVVTAIRKAGATSQYILLPGNNYSSASEFAGNSAAALLPIHNPDGSNTNLIFDIHQYLDSDFSGTNAECSTNKVDAFTALATFLRSHSRQAFLSETGGGNTQSCVRDLCQLLQYCDANADVFLGYTGWAAGSFDRGYVLSETPAFANGQWTDQLLVSSCIKR